MHFLHLTHSTDSVSVLPVNSGGRFTKFPTVSEAASDLAFSPFHDRLLATGGNECVRLWEVPSDLPGDTILSKPVLSLSDGEGQRVEMVRFHPTADNVSTLVSYVVCVCVCVCVYIHVRISENQFSLFGFQYSSDFVVFMCIIIQSVINYRYCLAVLVGRSLSGTLKLRVVPFVSCNSIPATMYMSQSHTQYTKCVYAYAILCVVVYTEYKNTSLNCL